MTAPEASEIEVAIDRLGADGDGIAESPSGRVYVPLAVPGDRVRIRMGPKRGDGHAASVLEWVTRDTRRVEPPCPHYGDCGGCSAQHIGDSLYAEWKRALVLEALAHRGITDPPVEALLRTAPGGRRRAELAASRGQSGILLGFHAKRSEQICDLKTCHVLRPRLMALLAPLRRALEGVLSKRGVADVLLTETDSGIDLLLTAPNLTSVGRTALTAIAEDQDLARVSFREKADAQPEPVALRRMPAVMFGEVAVAPPPGAFLQASAEAEAWMVGAVELGLGRAKRVADLYAGCGTFALALATDGRKVHAVEGDAAQVAALNAAAGKAQLVSRLTTETRDLDRRPLFADDLAAYDAVVFDPPRAGAARQAVELARSKVKTVVAVSCAPASFARDARTLIDGGYKLVRVQPIDQFVWSSAVELVAQFIR
ncbi:MAG: class I SAM-dependent RNA methyltransferase [Alphaproteobacteria bacterium]|nr:class I SAM-dependent RNA methyltransferase [Alphaproteobacteria bacterium]